MTKSISDKVHLRDGAVHLRSRNSDIQTLHGLPPKQHIPGFSCIFCFIMGSQLQSNNPLKNLCLSLGYQCKTSIGGL